MNAAKSFRDLGVYQLARAAADQIVESSKSFSHEERYPLTDQIRRSSRTTKAMILEAWARQRYKAAFVSKIDEALGMIMKELTFWFGEKKADAAAASP